MAFTIHCLTPPPREHFAPARVSVVSQVLLAFGHKGALMMRRVLLVLICCALPAVSSGLADVTGRWRLTISNADSAIAGVAALEQSGDKITGWMGPNEKDTTPVSGVLNGDRLTLKTHPKPGFAVPFDTCELTVSGDRMTGSIQPKGEAKSAVEFVDAPGAGGVRQ